MNLRNLFLSLLLVCIISCGNSGSDKKSRQMRVDTGCVSTMSGGVEGRLFGRIDSVSIEYSANVLGRLTYSSGELILSGDAEKRISDRDIIEKFLGFVDAFLISKIEPIELSRTKREAVITDYSQVKYVVLSSENIVLRESLHLGEEGYDIVYNPKYLEFFQFLEELFIDKLPFAMVDQKPVFNGGGIEEFGKWLQGELKPQINGIKGRVVVEFEVNSEGLIQNVRVIRGVDVDLDDAVVRVVSSSPAWIPGKQHGIPLTVRCGLSVEFN